MDIDVGIEDINEVDWQLSDMTDEDVRLDHIPDVVECRQLRRKFEADEYWPNVWHINDHGNTDLLSVGWNGAKIVKSWV